VDTGQIFPIVQPQPEMAQEPGETTMLIFPIIALVFVGGSYFLAIRFLPAPVAVKAMPWMTGAGLVGYFVGQILFAFVLGLFGISAEAVGLPLLVAVSLLGALVAASLVLRGFAVRHRRRKAQKDAQSSVF